MLEVLKEETPVARKEHRCNFCGGIIPSGERYVNQTIAYDGTVYTWKCHEHCYDLTSNMEYDSEYGTSEDDFHEWIYEYVSENHFDKEKDDIEDGWCDKSVPELAKMIYEEIKNKEGKNGCV